MSTENSQEKPGMKERVKEELRIYAWLTLYLFICFAVLMMYETSVGGGDQATAIHYSVALIKALVIGKFLLIGKAIGVGKRATQTRLVHRVATRTLGFIIILIIFKILEELIIGWVHGHGAAQALAEIADKSLMGIVSPILVMILLLIPLSAFVELERALGTAQWSRLLKGEDRVPEDA